MLAPLTFRFPDGRSISPLQVAPWGADNDASLPGVLRRLRGEWPCIPYGASRPPRSLPVGWCSHAAEDAWDHGYTANHEWHLLEHTDQLLTIGIDYPDDNPIVRLERTVRPVQHAAEIAVELRIHSRCETQVPLALHPTFAVPATGVHITAAHAQRIDTYPVPTEPGVSRLQANAHGTHLDSMPAIDGTLALNRLPLPFATEELMQMVNCRPPFQLHYVEADMDVQLNWDTNVLPDALIWISNGGRAHAPWSGRHYALGIEPMSGFFDLGRVVTPSAEHPLAHERGVTLRPEKPLVVRYQIAASLR
jgi:hypothetical protein